MRTIRMIQTRKEDLRIYYREDPALPAVIILTMPFLTPGGKVVTLGEVPMVKPAGVRIEFEYYIKAIVEVAFNFWISLLGGALPEL